MKKIIGYISVYFSELNKVQLLLVTSLTAIMIFCNYYFSIDSWIAHLPTFFDRFGYRYIVSLVAFGLPYLFIKITKRESYISRSLFLLMLFIAPAIFSLKMALITNFRITALPDLNHYWNRIIYWPLRLLILYLILLILWKKYYRTESFFGVSFKKFDWRPYAAMLLFMIPLIALSATQGDFQHVYPKMRMISGDLEHIHHAWLYKLLFEISYGSDFISIELFFRGFLILAFIQWAGKDCILPMACFYCSIHFGKPLGECISSYFGGMLLGIVVYHTRSIFGGLMVHLGIAWLMEAAGYLGNMLK